MAEELNPLLHGADAAAGLVGAAAAPGGVRLWWREPETAGAGASSNSKGTGVDGQPGALREELVAYKPFFLLSHPELLDTFKPAPVITPLHGENLYRFRVECEDWKHLDAAVKEVGRAFRANKEAYEAEPHFVSTDPVTQYLLASGRTSFKGLTPEDPATLLIGLRAIPAGGADYADPAEPGDEIGMVLLESLDGSFSRLIFRDDAGNRLTEKQLLEEVTAAIAEYNPDILAGHELYKGVVDYLNRRARRVKLKLPWGRGGEELKVRSSRAPAAERTLEYPRADVVGRSLVDTWFLTTYYDIVKRDLENYDPSYVAGYLDPAWTEPLLEPQWRYEELLANDPDALVADLHRELNAARRIYRTLIGSYFAQAQMLPLGLQDCVVRGNAVKINHLLLREYLRRGESIPAPVEGRTFIGGFTELRQTGLLTGVLNVDIASLYPSIMLNHNVHPDSDSGGVFNPLLRELTLQRLAAKKLARSSPDAQERVLADARQAAFKIFINSFFGYLGTDRMNWADPQQSAFITTNGQLLVRQLAAAVEAEGGSVIEIDTDGVYFIAPPGCADPAVREALQQRLNGHLPDGISAELGEFYPVMLSHRVKNYALLSETGEITIRGSGLKSRGLEPYLHQFLAAGVADILRGTPEKVTERHASLRAEIQSRGIDIRRLAKTDTLIESLEQYRAKTGMGGRNKAAAYEVALTSRRPLRAGDQVSYYISGEKASVKAFEAARPLRSYDPEHPDYNIAYYVKKLDENLKKVQGYLSGADGDGTAEAGGGGESGADE